MRTSSLLLLITSATLVALPASSRAQHVHGAEAAPSSPPALSGSGASAAAPHPAGATGADAPASHQAHGHGGTHPQATAPVESTSPHVHAGHAMRGALGAYAAARESSGTAWQPDASEHGGLHASRGGWGLMAHGTLNLVHDRQSGPRGGEKTFVAGMLMGMARRPLGDGTLQFKAMFSPDPLMGARGYPLLLASGETADGVEHLVDRQHPHDFVMELSASVSQALGASSSVFAYAGLPGEPAFGPPAFMHREAILDSPEAPISHHWLDSTHISMGVVTAGLVLDSVKLEASRFNAREPDQHRWNIETAALDSTALRASWNPGDALSLQASWGRFKDAEQLEPGVEQTRWSASALYAREVAPGWKLAGTLAWGRKSIDHHGEQLDDDAWTAEASLKHAAWTVFGRGERTENRELLEADDGHGPAYAVGKLSLGALRTLYTGEHGAMAAGALLSMNRVPGALGGEYGGRHPLGGMLFLRLTLE